MARSRSIVPALLAALGVTFAGIAIARAAARRREAFDEALPNFESGADGEEAEQADDLPSRLRDLTPADPSNLVKVGEIRLVKEAADSLRELISAARAAGIAAPILEGRSGYRSPETQERLWKRALQKYRARLSVGGKTPTDAEVEKEARRWVAPPSKSTHQTGRAVDLELGKPRSSEAAAASKQTAGFLWMQKNASRFGWVNYPAEPWHWEFVADAKPNT